MQLIEGAMGASAGVHVDHAQFSAGMGSVTGNGGMLGEGAFATRQGEQAPAQFGPTFTLAGHGAFALTVGQGVGHLLHTLRIGAFDFVQRQQGVIAPGRLNLQATFGHVPTGGEHARVTPYRGANQLRQ
ncbi:hypothetical protein D9M72_592620 [compost metagenome]